MKVTVPGVRDFILITLGSGSLVNQFFVVHNPSLTVIGANLLMILGSAAINAYWLKLPSAPTPPIPVASPSQLSPQPPSSSGSSSA